MKITSYAPIIAAILVMLANSSSSVFAQSEEKGVPFKISWTPHFEKGVVGLTITNIGSVPIKVLSQLSYYCVTPGQMPHLSSGAEEPDVYSPTVLFVAKKRDNNLPGEDSGGIEPGIIIIDPGQMKEIKLSSSDIIEIAKQCQEADFFLMLGSKQLKTIVMMKLDNIWKAKQ